MLFIHPTQMEWISYVLSKEIINNFEFLKFVIVTSLRVGEEKFVCWPNCKAGKGRTPGK